MAKKIKKGTKGERTQYLTRSKAIRKLQVSLKDFRRLCILKGIYPREPKKKFEGTNKTYYHIKDIKILLHDNLLSKFREIKAHLKKHKKLVGKKEKKLAEDHLKKIPKYNLSHIIKERYPSFLDALKDLDDALCLISLYASLPQHQTLEISKEDIQTCQRLSKEFMLYCTLSQCFKKSFFSIKGIYYQVEIMGQNITWIAPYQFNQRLPFDIDYKVMNTFLEFYQALLKFINFKLFTDIGIAYPLNQEFYKVSNILNVDLIRQIQVQTRKKFEEGQQDKQYAISEEFKETAEMKNLSKKQENQKKSRELFSKCNFFLNRETPIYCLQYLILSFGGVFRTDEDEDKKFKVTHHVIDRPLLGGKYDQSRDYVQPQWVIDSINNLFLLPTAQYKPGVPPPPHLSPFVDNVQEGYMPNRQKEINQLKGEEYEDVDESEEEIETQQAVQPKQSQKQAQSKPEKKEKDEVKQKEKGKQKKVKGDADSSSSDESEEEEESEQQKKIKNMKLKKELKKEQEELGKILMSKRQRRLYEEIEKNQKVKKDQVKKLKEKKKKITGQQK